MKRALALTVFAAMALTLLCACGNTNSQATVIPSDPAEATQPAESTALPSPTPAPEPSDEPSAEPSEEASAEPTQEPSQASSAAPAPTSKPASTPTPEPTPTPAGGVDLAAFYSDVTSKYEFGFLQLASAEMLDGYYPGMTGIETEQCLVYICGISINNGEFGLVQVKNSGDVAAVKAVFQARIDYMAGDGNGPGGAQYPMAMDQWENNSRVVSNGNYIMMVVHENCDEIVSQFNALF